MLIGGRLMSRCKNLDCTVSEVGQADRHYHFVDGHMDAYSRGTSSEVRRWGAAQLVERLVLSIVRDYLN